MQAQRAGTRQGIDISHWNGDIDWQAVKNDGICFVVLKATEGRTFTDPRVDENYHGAKSAGLDVGFYHFARFDSIEDGVDEAKHFLEVVSQYDNDLPHALDLESRKGNMSDEALTQAAEQWAQYVQGQTGDKIMVYSYPWFIRTQMTSALTNYLLWYAYYGEERPDDNRWSKWFILQYTDEGQVAGISGPVDGNTMDTTLVKATTTEDQTDATNDSNPDGDQTKANPSSGNKGGSNEQSDVAASEEDSRKSGQARKSDGGSLVWQWWLSFVAFLKRIFSKK